MPLRHLTTSIRPMKTLLPKKNKYSKQFADLVNAKYKQLRYGISTCKPQAGEDLACIRMEILGWQSNEDEGALSQSTINYTTWLPVSYRNDSMAQYDSMHNAWGGEGHVHTNAPNGPQIVGVGYAYGNGLQNIIEVNAGGAMTRINLNPAITISQNSSFQFIQQTPSLEWVIQHNMGITPNVMTEDLVGNDIIGTIDVIDANLIKIHFNQAVAGKAYLS